MNITTVNIHGKFECKEGSKEKRAERGRLGGSRIGEEREEERQGESGEKGMERMKEEGEAG